MSVSCTKINHEHAHALRARDLIFSDSELLLNNSLLVLIYFFHLYSNVYRQNIAQCSVQMHAGAINNLVYGFAPVQCTGDNLLAEARGLSARTDAQTIQ